MSSGTRIVLGLAGIAGFLVIWELVVLAAGWTNETMASPIDVLAALFGNFGTILVAAWETIWRVVVGILAAVAVGTSIGMLIGFSNAARQTLSPLFRALNFVPMATIAVAIALVFAGVESFATILAAFLLAVYPVISAMSEGIARTDPEMENMFRAWGASRGFMRRKVVLPGVLPDYLRALKTAMPLAFVGANLVEIIGAHGAGLGNLLISGRAASDVPLIFAVMLVQAVLVFLLHGLASVLHSAFASWDSNPGSAAADGI